MFRYVLSKVPDTFALGKTLFSDTFKTVAIDYHVPLMTLAAVTFQAHKYLLSIAKSYATCHQLTNKRCRCQYKHHNLMVHSQQP